MANNLSGYAKASQDQCKELEAKLAAKTRECEHLKGLASGYKQKIEQCEQEIALHKGEAEKLQNLAAQFMNEADDADKKADYWEQEYHSLNRDYNRLLKQ